MHSGRLLLRFAGVNDRNAAEALRGTMLIAEIDPEDRPEDPEEFYDHQLIGLDVVLLDGTLVGELSEVVHLPYQDLLTVTRPDGTEVLVPFVTRIVPTIDLENQRAVIDPPPGLIDPAEAVVVRSDDASGAEEASEEEGSEEDGSVGDGFEGAGDSGARGE